MTIKVKNAIMMIDSTCFLVDCLWGPWYSSECSASCGNSTKQLTRSIIRNATNGGKKCEGDNLSEAQCDYTPCPGMLIDLYFL